MCRNTCFECNYNTVALVLMSFTTNTFPLGGMSFISWQTNSLQNPEENAAVPLCIAGLVLNSTGSPTCGVYKFSCWMSEKVLMDKVLVDIFGNIPASANDQILMTRYQSNKIELVYLVVNWHELMKLKTNGFNMDTAKLKSVTKLEIQKTFRSKSRLTSILR